MKLPVEESEFIPCDILDIARHIRSHNAPAATRFAEAFKSSEELLSPMPALGRERPDLGVPETRSWRVNGFQLGKGARDVTDNNLKSAIRNPMKGRRDLQQVHQSPASCLCGARRQVAESRAE